jgi:hypothetical protein
MNRAVIIKQEAQRRVNGALALVHPNERIAVLTAIIDEPQSRLKLELPSKDVVATIDQQKAA